MPSISSCPYCREQLAVPSGAAADADVRCPLCQAEFTLGEVHDIALPELILVATTREASIAGALAEAKLAPASTIDAWAASHEEEESAEGATPEVDASQEVGEESDVGVNSDAATAEDESSGEEASGEEDDVASDESSSGEAEPATTHAPDPDRVELGNEPPPKGASTIEEVALSVVSSVGIVTGPDKRSAGDESADSYDPASFRFGEAPSESFDAEVAAAIESRPRPKKKQANMALEMAKVIGGGFLGLVLAYQILLCAGRDPLGIARSWPGFVPAAMRE